mmetsp:Transcript_42133/g.134717  ORF Transcript_42133/g.134717 Transcript_42133/m.134717 type:complete len:201 (+) Transcript_42133:107-709(+)
MWQGLPSITTGEWGTCAFVGLSDAVLRRSDGADIDQHDTVIRIGQVPLSKFKTRVGTKATIVISRSREAMSEGKLRMARVGSAPKEYRGASFYVEGNHGMKNMPFLEVNNLERQGSAGGGDVYFHHELYRRMSGMVRIRGSKRTRHSTTGLDHVLRVVVSGYCTRVDVYGLGADGGGVYWNKPEVMAKIHSPALESWVLH